MQTLVDAMERKDVHAVVATLHPDVELRSPISRRVRFRGHAQVREVLEVVYREIGPVEVTDVIGDGTVRVLLVRSSVRGHPLEEAFVLRLHDDGRVAQLTLYVRTMPQLVTFAAAIGPPLARRRGRLRAAALTLLFAPLAAVVRAGEPIGVRLTGAGTPVRRPDAID